MSSWRTSCSAPDTGSAHRTPRLSRPRSNAGFRSLIAPSWPSADLEEFTWAARSRQLVDVFESCLAPHTNGEAVSNFAQLHPFSRISLGASRNSSGRPQLREREQPCASSCSWKHDSRPISVWRTRQRPCSTQVTRCISSARKMRGRRSSCRRRSTPGRAHDPLEAGSPWLEAPRSERVLALVLRRSLGTSDTRARLRRRSFRRHPCPRPASGPNGATCREEDGGCRRRRHARELPDGAALLLDGEVTFARRSLPGRATSLGAVREEECSHLLGGDRGHRRDEISTRGGRRSGRSDRRRREPGGDPAVPRVSAGWRARRTSCRIGT